MSPSTSGWSRLARPCCIDLEALDTQLPHGLTPPDEDIVRLTPEELKRKMAEKEAAQAAAVDARG